MKAAYGVIGVVVACSVSVAAQWAKVPDPSVPRDAQGNIRKDAPPPRTADGKTDFSGMWMRANSGPPNEGRGGRGARCGSGGRGGRRRAGSAHRQPTAPAAGAAAATPRRRQHQRAVLGRTRRRHARAADGSLPVRSERPAGRDVLRGRRQHGRRSAVHAVGARHPETALRRGQGQGQSGRELHADGLPAVPSAAAAAQDHPDAEDDPDRVRSELRPAAHLPGPPASARRATRSRGGTATRSATGRATRSSSKRTTCAARKTAPTTGGSTSTAARTAARRNSPSASAGRRSITCRSISRSRIRRRTRSPGPSASISASWPTKSPSSSSATRTSSSVAGSRSIDLNRS